MANDSPLKLIDMKDMLSRFGQNAVDKSLAFTGVLPGQGQIPQASPEFLASRQNPFPNALNLPIEAYTGNSLAGTLGQMWKQGVVLPGQQGMEDRQSRGFFADNLRQRMGAAGL
jgi:hypothetical protein